MKPEYLVVIVFMLGALIGSTIVGVVSYVSFSNDMKALREQQCVVVADAAQYEIKFLGFKNPSAEVEVTKIIAQPNPTANYEYSETHYPSNAVRINGITDFPGRWGFMIQLNDSAAYISSFRVWKAYNDGNGWFGSNPDQDKVKGCIPHSGITVDGLFVVWFEFTLVKTAYPPSLSDLSQLEMTSSPYNPSSKGEV